MLIFLAINTAILVLVCLSAVYFDLRKGLIPNVLTYSVIVAGLLLGLIDQELNILSRLLGVIVGGGFFLVLWFFRGIGAGDVKLMAAVGAIVGWPFIVDVIFFTALSGGVMAIMFLLWKKAPTVIEEESDNELPRRKQKMPYALAIAAGALLSIVLGFLS